MAAIFRDFSFEAASRHTSGPNRAERAAMSVSPTSIMPLPPPARLPTPPPCSVGELTQALDQQNLRVVVDCPLKSANEPLTPPSDDVSFSAELSERPPQLSTIRLTSATLRMQRQANVRMQCSSSHIKELNSLVEKMIEVEDQCRICERKSPAPPSPALSMEDEGVDMDYTPTDPKEELRSLLPFYRAGERDAGCTRVTKTVRMRRKSRISKRPSK